MLKGFKDFLLQGNVVDLAVAIVIGGAFTAIVTAFSDSIIDPLIAVLGGDQEIGFAVQLVENNPATIMDFGTLITAAINFLLIAAVVYFVFVAPMNKVKERRGHTEAATDNDLLIEIRDLLAKGQRPTGYGQSG